VSFGVEIHDNCSGLRYFEIGVSRSNLLSWQSLITPRAVIAFDMLAA
jgi:hypothetical protein